jgi:S1-C subfamily serine protease
MKAQGVDGISFAIPIDTANQVITQLLRNKRVVRPYLGLKMTNLVPDKKGSKKLPPAFQVGDTVVQVIEVDAGSPADAAGIQRCALNRACNAVVDFFSS